MEISRRTALAGALLAAGSSLIPGRRFPVGEAQAAKGSGEAVVVIGAGMAGLSAARHLARAVVLGR